MALKPCASLYEASGCVQSMPEFECQGTSDCGSVACKHVHARGDTQCIRGNGSHDCTVACREFSEGFSVHAIAWMKFLIPPEKDGVEVGRIGESGREGRKEGKRGRTLNWVSTRSTVGQV